MADTGYKSAGSAVNQPKGGNGSSWSSPGNVTSDDNACASSLIPSQGYSDWIRTYNFNCGIPDGSTINGIEVKIERKSEHYGVHRDDDVILAVGLSGKTSNAKADIFYITSNGSIATYGGSNNLWNYAWTLAEINNLSIFFSVCNEGCCSESCYIDHIQVRIWYTASGTPTNNLLLLGSIF